METPTTVFNISNLVLASPFKFSRHGQSGIPVSDLFPHLAGCVDDMAIIRSMVANHSEHTAGNYFMHSGSGFQGRPSMGSWVTYGLGSECDDLPGFVVMESGLIPPGGLDLFGGGFLPAAYQGTLFRRGEHPIADIHPREQNPQVQRNKLGLLRRLNRGVVDRFGAVSELEATISNYELAFRMQAAVPDLIDLDSESEATRKLYGLDEKDTEDFGRQCLLARRMVERGVRFIELINPRRRSDRWDQHQKLIEGHRLNAAAVDKPIAALIKDLKARGLLDSTLIVWGGEFGRTPTAQFDPNMDMSTVGRDHNPFGFTMWMAGGGRHGRDGVRRHRRVRLFRDREQDARPRSPRDDVALAGPGPQKVNLPLQRPRHAPDRRARQRGSRSAGVARFADVASPEPAFLSAWRGKVHEKPVSTRRAACRCLGASPSSDKHSCLS